MDVVDDHYSEVVGVHVLESVDDLSAQPLSLQHLEHPCQHHEVESSHVVVVKYASSLVPAVGHEDCILCSVDAVVNSPLIPC